MDLPFSPYSWFCARRRCLGKDGKGKSYERKETHFAVMLNHEDEKRNSKVAMEAKVKQGPRRSCVDGQLSQPKD